MTVTSAIIPASGQGKRLGSDSDKAFIDICGVPLIIRTLSPFQHSNDISEIVVVVRESQIPLCQELVEKYGITKVARIVAGGDLRQDSVRNGIAALSDTCDIVAIHDAARPFVTSDLIGRCISAADEDGAAIAAVPVIDTIKVSDDGKFVDCTLDRSVLYAVQTPQTFRTEIINRAYQSAYSDGFYGTDDASLAERIGIKIRIVSGSYENIKITTPNDLLTAEHLIQRTKSNSTPGAVAHIGHGYDIHQFAEGRRLVIGGVEFPSDIGLLGHSDADVLLHAISDAILGAAGAGDIGKHFPDTDPIFKDANSLVLLARVGEIVNALGWHVENIDATLIAEKPKIAGHTHEMRRNIGQALNISPDCISIKATTAEGLGDIGRGLGIECHAVAIITSIPR